MFKALQNFCMPWKRIQLSKLKNPWWEAGSGHNSFLDMSCSENHVAKCVIHGF